MTTYGQKIVGDLIEAEQLLKKATDLMLTMKGGMLSPDELTEIQNRYSVISVQAERGVARAFTVRPAVVHG